MVQAMLVRSHPKTRVTVASSEEMTTAQQTRVFPMTRRESVLSNEDFHRTVLLYSGSNDNVLTLTTVKEECRLVPAQPRHRDLSQWPLHLYKSFQ